MSSQNGSCRPKATLDDYFLPPVANQKKQDRRDRAISEWMQPENQLGWLPDQLLQASLFSFLTIHDLTRLAGTCKYAAILVDTFRGPPPYIVRHDVTPKKLAYRTVDWVTEVSPMGQVENAHCVQTVRFLVRTRDHGVAQIELRLGHMMWSEAAGFLLDGPKSDEPTWVHFRVSRQIQWKTNKKTSRHVRLERKAMFEFWNPRELDKDYYEPGDELEPDDETYFYQQAFWVEDYKEPEKPQPRLWIPMTVPYPRDLEFPGKLEAWKRHLGMPLKVENSICHGLDLYLLCAKHVANSKSFRYNFPSFQYLVSKIPNRLNKFMPTAAINPSPGPLELHDRKHVLPFLFRRPSCQQEWLDFFDENDELDRRWNKASGLWYEYDIHDIPWLAEWYPKPVVVQKQNILSCLPMDVVGQYMLTYLSNEEFIALTAACPSLLSRVADNLRIHFDQYQRFDMRALSEDLPLL